MQREIITRLFSLISPEYCCTPYSESTTPSVHLSFSNFTGSQFASKMSRCKCRSRGGVLFSFVYLNVHLSQSVTFLFSLTELNLSESVTFLLRKYLFLVRILKHDFLSVSAKLKLFQHRTWLTVTWLTVRKKKKIPTLCTETFLSFVLGQSQ